MDFIKLEKDFKLLDNCILFFYSKYLQYGIMKKYMYLFNNLDTQTLCIDAEYFGGLAKRFKIRNLPTIITFKDKKETKRITGIVSSKTFQQDVI